MPVWELSEKEKNQWLGIKGRPKLNYKVETNGKAKWYLHSETLKPWLWHLCVQEVAAYAILSSLISSKVSLASISKPVDV